MGSIVAKMEKMLPYFEACNQRLQNRVDLPVKPALKRQSSRTRAVDDLLFMRNFCDRGRASERRLLLRIMLALPRLNAYLGRIRCLVADLRIIMKGVIRSLF